MCGITGVLNLTNPSPIEPGRLRKGNDALVHRGPDDEGVFAGTGVGLASRRLSIIDLAHGHQPMSNEDGTVQIVYNGEVYNHKTLRTELESLGHVFRTSADTEALLHGYEAWGCDGLLQRLRGMFAFAIWDGSRQTMFLARDRMGIKPLYFAEHNGRFYFASEIRSLLIHSGMPRRISLPSLDFFMQTGFVTAPHTLLDGVRKLLPAHYLQIKNGSVSIHRYWELSYEATHRGSEKAIIGEFRDRLQECVDTHLMSDVSLGALLSGGVDSTATVAFMRRSVEQPFTTVTIGFEDGGLDEAELAAASARALGTDHRPIHFTGDSMAVYPTVLYYQEEPAARPTHVALYHVFKTCRELGLKVVITGEGADELLGGYDWHKCGLLERALSNMPVSTRSVLGRIAPLGQIAQTGRNLIRVLRGVPTQVHHRYHAMIRVARPETGRAVFSSTVLSALGEGGRPILESWGDYLPSVRGRPEFDQVLWIQSRTRMPDYINHNLDRMSMAHSVEARPPFLDHTLWEFCASIPTGFKLRHSTEKYLLREAGKNLVPEPARLRPKAPLRVPFQRWVSRKRLPDWAEDAIGEERLRNTGFFDPAAVLRMRRETQTPGAGNVTTLMSVLTVQVWARLFLESPLSNEPPRW
jgi:asparagine synthase (glutamine-hydrolysing)